MQIYVVQPGDTVNSIATNYGITSESIIAINQLISPYTLVIGQSLLIDDNTPSTATSSIYTNGYAYPFISRWVLRETLSYLTTLSVFSYGFTYDGHLVPPPLDDEWMIDNASEFGVDSILTLTPLGPDGRFNNNLIHSVVNNEEYSNTLINELLATLTQKGYAGTDIDFEYILAQDRDPFTNFVRKTTESLNNSGFVVSVALAPKTSADQVGLLYEGNTTLLLVQ